MSQSPIKKGITTITWGSDSMTQSAMATAVVESISYKPHPVKATIETNVGTTGTMILVDDGFDATVKCVYDSNITWPVLGGTIQIKSPIFQTAKWCVVVGVMEDVARKKEATITIELEYRPDLSLAVP